MSGVSYINDAIEKKLLDLNVAYLAKVLSISGTTAKIQPLGMIKQLGETAKNKAPISDVPIANSARYKFTTKTIEYVSEVSLTTTSKSGYIASVSPNVTSEQEEIVVVSPLAVDDVVICICADRDITEARNGNNSVPSIGHHSISDSVIIGII